MANVFISYSRKDQQFVRELHAALVQRDLDTWVDWEDIPLTADFLQEIYTAIEAADTFVFVISPDSVKSEICGLEIAHAVEHGKRLIPVVRRPGAEKDVPPAVAKLNWIFFRPEDEFDASLNALVTAIATDLDHVHTHTRLLIRALEWENRGANASLLLGGHALREAEEWLTNVGDKNPQPTDLQREYVLASRRAQTGRLRTLVGAAAAAVVVSLALAVLALFQRGDALTQRTIAVTQQGIAETQRNDAVAQRSTAEAARTIADTERGRAVAQESTAVAQANARATAEARAVSERDAAEQARTAAQQARDEAVRQQRLAQSRALAASARVQLERDPELSVRLATEAMRLAPTREAEETLRRALGLSLSRLTLHGHTGEVRDVAYTPDGAAIVTGSSDGTARVWDTATGRERFAVRVPNGGGVDRVAVSPNGKTFVTAGGDGVVRLWDAATGASMAELRGHEKNVYALAFSRDGRWLATAGADATARVWDGTSGKEIAALRGHAAALWDVAFSPDGKRVVTASGDGTARVWDTERWQPVAELVGHSKMLKGSDTPFNRLEGAQFSPDNARIVTASFDGTARVWEAATGKQLFELRMYGQESVFQVLQAVYSPGGKRIVTVGSDGAASVWDAATGGKTAELRGHESLASGVAFSPDGLRIVTCSADQTARVWDAVTGEEIALLAGHTSGVANARFSPDGTHIATASYDGTARIWLAGPGQSATAVSHSVVSGASLSPDGATLRTVDGLGIVQTWDAATGTARDSSPPYDGKNIWFLTAFSPDGSRLALANRLDSGDPDAVAALRLTPEVVIWDVAARRVVAEMRGHTTAVNMVIFSPDGTRLLTADDGGGIGMWDAATGKLLFAVDHKANAKAVAFSGDGTRFASAGYEFIHVWDAATGMQIAEMTPLDAVNAVGLTRDGRRLVAGGSANNVRVWDVDTRTAVLELRGHTGFIRSASFNPDGRFILTSATDSTARVWDATTGQSLLVLHDHLITEGKAGVRAAWDATGRRIVTYADDYTVRVTACDACGTPDDLPRTVAARGIRDLTAEERARYLPETKP